MESIRIIPFCVPLTPRGGAGGSSSLPADRSSGGESNGVGVVGTITLRGQSAIVWFGWGTVERREDGGNEGDNNGSSSTTASSVGTGRPPMGSLSLSMPPSTRKVPSSSSSIPTSQLLGGSSEEDMMLGQQISARLAKRIGWPVFVSCSFSGWNDDSGRQDGMSPALAAGFDDAAMPAVLAEKEIARILMEEKERLNKQL